MGIYENLMKSGNTPSPTNTTPTQQNTAAPLPKGMVEGQNYVPESSSELQHSDVSQEQLGNYKAYNVDLRQSVGQFDEQLGQNQSWGEKTWHGAERLVGTTVTKLGEGVGYVGGFLDYGIHGFQDVSRMTDNGFSAAFQTMEDSIKKGAPIFTPPSVSNGGLLGKASSWSWWMDQGVDGAAFAISSMIPGVAFTKIGLGMKVASLLGEESSILKLAGGAKKFTAGLNTTAITAYNTVSEAAQEAKGVQDQVRDYYKDQIANGTISQDEVEQKAAQAAAGTFRWNVAALIGPNIIESKLLFGGPNEGSIIKKLFDPKTGKLLENAGQLTKKQLGKEVLKQAGLGFAREGLYEENIQTSIQNYESAIGEGKKDEGNVKTILSGMYDNLFTDAGRESIFLGGVMGAVMGGVGGGIQEKKKATIIANASEFMNKHIGSYIDSLNSIVKDAFETNEDGSLKLDEENKPIINPERASQVLATHAQKSQIEAIKTAALLSGNKELYDHIKNNEFTAFALPFLQYEGGLDVLNQQIDALAEQELQQTQDTENITSGTKSTDLESLKTNYKEKAKKIYDSLQTIKNKTGAWDFTKSSGENKTFDSWLQSHQQNLALQSSQAEFFRNKATEAWNEYTKASTGITGISLNEEANMLTSEEKDRIASLKKKYDNYQELFKASNEKYKELSSKEGANKEYESFKSRIDEIKKQEDSIKAEESKVKEDNIAAHEDKIDRLKEIDDQIYEIDNQLETAGDQATPQELDELAATRKSLEEEKLALAKSASDESSIKARNENISHINQHSLKEGESANYNGEKVTIMSIDSNTGLASVNNGKQTFDNIPVKDITKIIVPEGTTNENVSATMTEKPETDINSSQVGKLEDTIGTNVSPTGRSNVIMNKQFDSHKKNKDIKKFTWKRDSKGFAVPESNINNIDFQFINSPTSLLPGSPTEYKIVIPNEEQAKVFKGQTAIGIYQNDKLVGFVASPVELKETDDSDYKKRIESENKVLSAQRSLIIDKLNNNEQVTSAISDKGTGNYIARITPEGKGIFTDGDGNVISLFDREFRPEDLVGGNPIFVVVRNGILSLPDIQESNLLKGKAYRDTISKIKSDLSDLSKNGNPYSKVEGQTFMLVKSANGKFAPIPVYSTYQNDSTANQILNILDQNVVETDFKKLVAVLNPYLYAGAAVDRKVQIFQNTGLDGQTHLNIKIEGNNYSLAEIKNNPVRREAFKSDLLKQRQNIFADSLNTKDDQDKIKENRSITTNVYPENGQYFVQPYIEFASILPTAKVEEINNSAPFKDVPVEESKKSQEELTRQFDDLLNKASETPVTNNPFASFNAGEDDIIEDTSINEQLNQEAESKFGDIDVNSEVQRSKSQIQSDKQENIKEVKSWFKKNLPNIDLQIVDELFKLDGTRAEAWGLFQNNIAKVIKGAPEGTSYHEAFHAVFRSMLTDQEKLDLIKEAKDKYGIPTLEELDDLNKSYNNKLTDEQLMWLFYEEKLADDHAKFADEFEPKSWGGKILDFFKKIGRLFGFFQDTVKSKTDELFNKINTGEFANKIPQVANISRAIANLSSQEVFRPIINKEGKSLFTAAYKQEKVKSLANKFQAEFLRLISTGLSADKISPAEIYRNIYNDYVALKQKLIKELEVTPKNKQLITKLVMFTDPNNFQQFIREANKMLANMKISIKEKVDVKEQDLSIDESDESDNVEISSIVGNVTKGLIDRVHISGLSSASTRLKMFVSSIPVKYKNGKIMTDDFGDIVYHDFNSLYYFIERNLIGLNNLEDQLDELDLLSSNRPELKTIIDRLTERQPSQSPEEFQRLRDDFTSNFSKQHLGYNLVMSEVDNATGAVNFTIMDANRMTVGREVFNDWNNNLLKAEKNTISEIKDGVVKMNGTAKAKKAKVDWDNLITSKDNITFDNVNKMLLKIGIEYSPDALEEIIKENSSDFINDVSYMFSYYASENPEEIKAYAMKSQMRLVAYETKYMLNRYSSSFQNGEKKNIWSIQLPSFTSKLVAKLTNRNIDIVKAELAELRRDKSNTYSNLINKFDDKTFRDNFRINYLDSLKDKKGTGLGVTFTNMNSKDYLAMSIALYHNKATNQNRKASEDINKYIYITPSDKSMAMIVDSNSYGVTINPSGQLNESSEIVEKYYNTVKMEIQRISDQLKIEAKLKSGELTKEDLLLHYHYSKGNKTIESIDPKDIKLDGFAYQFNEFTSLNDKVLPMLKKSLETGIDYSEVESTFKDEILNNIVEELNKELVLSIIEATDKEIIEVDHETGKLVNKSLDWGSKPMQSPLEDSHKIRQTLGDFALNQRLSYLELSNLFNGDIAMYKTNDLQKRSYQSQAMGVNIVAAQDEVVKTIVVKDVELEADFLNKGNSKYNSWIDTLVSLGYSESKAKRMLGKYENTNVTDASIIVHPTLFKKMNKRVWDDKKEEAFNIAEGITKNPTKKQLEDAKRVLSGVKPFGYGRRFNSKLGVNVHEQVKTFFVPAFKSFIKDNPLLSKQRGMMDKSGVEMLAFESSFKAAMPYRFNINELTQDNYDNHSFDYKLDNLSVQVDNPNHSFEEENDSLRQVKMIMVGAIDQNKTYGGTSGREILDTIDSMESANIDEDIENLMKKFNSLDDSFKKDIQEKLTTRGATENMEKMLEIINNEWSFPLNSGTHEIPAQNMLSSLITNNAIKQAFTGGNMVNTTSLGVDSSGFMKQSEIDKNPEVLALQSKLQHIRENKSTGVIEHAQCMLPAYMEAFYDKNGSLKDLDKIDEDLKELFLYRIPTEFLHSMLPAKVIGFLPSEMGNYILLPYDITTQMGLDFDFDKLFFVRPEYETIDGVSRKVKYDSSKSITENSRAARNNRIFDSYMKMLRSRENFDKIIAPSDFHELRQLKTDISKESSKSAKKSFFSGTTQRELKERNHIGLALKAMTSLEVTGHSYSTKMNLSIDDKFRMKFNNIEEKNLSSIENIDKQNIAQLLCKVQAAVMDDVKDPILDTLGINKNTIAVFSAVLRTGYSLNTAVNLITQPAIVELSKKLDSNNEKTKKQGSGRVTIDSLTQQYINRYNNAKNQLSPERQADLIKNEEFYIGENPTYNINDTAEKSNEIDQSKWGMEEWRQFAKKVDVNNFSKENITANPKIADYYLFQAKVLFNYGRYDVVGQALGKLNRFFAINTQIGPNVENINDQVYNRDEILAKEFPIKGVSGFENLKALNSYSKVLTAAHEYFKKEFPYDTMPFRSIKTQIIMDQLDYNNPIVNKLKQDKRMKINGFISSYLDRKLPVFSKLLDSNEQKRLMIDFSKHISDIKSLKNEQFADLRKNLFIDSIKVAWQDNGPEGVKFISLKGNKLESNIKDNITEAFYSLYTNSDTKELAIDFVKYSVISSGLYSGLNSYHDLIPAEILTDIGFASHRKIMNSELNNNPLNVLNTVEQKKLKELIIRNFAADLTKVANDTAFTVDRTNNTLTTNYMKVQEAGQGYSLLTAKPTSESPAEFTQYVRVFMSDVSKVELYKNITNEGDSLQTYQRISSLGQKARFIEMVTDEKDESLIPANNYDYSVEQAAGENAYDPAIHDANYNPQEETVEGESQPIVEQATEDIPENDNTENQLDNVVETASNIELDKNNPFSSFVVSDEDSADVQTEDDVQEDCN